MYEFNSHCSYCGTLYPSSLPQSPRLCGLCGKESYVNPKPVSVLIQPIGYGFLIAQRAIQPKIGGWAFPAGHHEMNETWQECAARELWEETGIKIDHTKIKLFDLVTTPSNANLAFGLAEPLNELPEFVPNAETIAIKVITEYESLCFQSHDDVLRRLFCEGVNSTN